MYFIEVMGAELPDEGQALTAAGSYTLVSTFIPEDAAEPEAIVRPTALAFGSVAIGDSALLLFTVRSAGGGTVSVDAPFSVQQGAEVNVGPGESQTVIIRFQPTRVGTFGAFVLLMLNTGEVQVPVGGDGYPLAPINGYNRLGFYRRHHFDSDLCWRNLHSRVYSTQHGRRNLDGERIGFRIAVHTYIGWDVQFRSKQNCFGKSSVRF